MPSTVQELIDTLHLEKLDETRYRGDQVNTYFQRTYGGQVLAQALLAGYRSVRSDHLAHSLHAYFLRPGDTNKPIDYEVAALRDGGTFSTRRITASQAGRPMLIMMCSFKVSEPGLDHHEPAPTGVPLPRDCPHLIDVMNERFGPNDIWHEWDALDVRFAGDSTTVDDNAGHPTAWMRVWVRTAHQLPDATPARVNHAILAYLSDLTLLSVSALPHEITFMSNQVQTASVGHSMWFHRPCTVDEWLLYDMVSPSAHNAIGYGSGQLFQDGDLIASCSQEGLVRVVADRPMLT